MKAPRAPIPTDETTGLASRLTGWLKDTDRLVVPEDGIERLLTRFPTVPQRRRWWRIAWPGRWDDASRSVAPGGIALEHQRRSPTMFGPSRLLAAGALVALVGAFALRGVPVTPPPDPGADGVLVVAADGSGEFTTITAAVAVAAAGDTVLLRPGTYGESVVVEEDITIAGDGEREAVIVQPDVGGSSFTLSDSSATLTGLTLRGPGARLIIQGGAPTIEGLLLDAVGTPFNGSNVLVRGAIEVSERSTALLRGNVIRDSGGIDVSSGSAPRIEGNEIVGGGNMFIDPTAGPAVVVDNVIRDQIVRGVWLGSTEAVVVAGNTIIGFGEDGITVAPGQGPGRTRTPQAGVRAVVRDNTVQGDGMGIVVEGGDALVEGNDVSGAAYGIALNLRRYTQFPTPASGPTVVGNTIHDNTLAGIRVDEGSPILEGNTIVDNDGSGVMIWSGAAPTLTGNTVCGSRLNIALAGGASSPDLAGNDICPDGAGSGG
jgi:parallel beta-helix repeat protein